MNELNNYQIKFLSDNEVVSNITVKSGQLIMQVPKLTKQNYTFNGWLYNNQAFDVSNPISSNMDLIADWVYTPNKVNYDLGEVFYLKEDLFREFFTDFYNYLNEYYPDSEVKNFSLNEFLNIAGDWGYGKGTMTGLAEKFHSYYIEFDADGIVENQSEAGFIGYCYKNNKYRSFIKFIITFFAYWRTDEDYSSSDIHGNDFFYSSWASLVDTCKFFYLTYDTLFKFQRTERLLNCFSEIDSVIDVSNLPVEANDVALPDLKRRGYVFEGWYLDNQYQNQVTSLTKDMANITIFGKFSKAKYTVSYLNENKEVLKEELYEYQDYIKVDDGYVYIDTVENQGADRVLIYTKEMPIINNIVFVKK